MSGPEISLTTTRWTVVCRSCGSVQSHTHDRGEFVEHTFVCPECGPLHSPYGAKSEMPSSKRGRRRRMNENRNGVEISYRVVVDPLSAPTK